MFMPLDKISTLRLVIKPSGSVADFKYFGISGYKLHSWESYKVTYEE